MSRVPQRGATGLLTVLAAAGVLGALGLLTWYVFGQSEPTPWDKPATASGATVRLTYIGSECRDGAHVDLDEGPTRVVVTVRETVRTRSCSDVGVRYDVEVRLGSPLADRRLVDGACEMSEYAQYTQCEPSRATVETGGP